MSGPARGARRPGGRLAIAATNMAAGTLLSRITGLARLATLAYALGVGASADAYNLANTTPNIVHDLVLGGVAGATFVPVFVEHLSRQDSAGEREGWEGVSAVFTLSVVILAAATIAFEIAAPLIIHLYTIGNHSRLVTRERAVGTTLLRVFVPQLAFYGLISLFTALLNARRRFGPPAFVPIVNNLVSIGIYLGFASILRHPSLTRLGSDTGALVLLGAGTTLGVALQCAALVPSLRSDRRRLRWLWAPRHAAVRAVARLSGWTFAFVVANQVTAFVVLAIAAALRPGSVSAYTYAFTFFQLPYGVVAVSVMSAMTPEMAACWAGGDDEGFARYFSRGLRALIAVIVPAAVGMLILAQPLVDLFLAHGAAGPHNAGATGGTLAMLALGLPGFSVYLYAVRGFQAMQNTRTVFGLYLIENGINLALALALAKPLGVKGIALSLSIAYTAAAVLAVRKVRRWSSGSATARIGAPFAHVLTTSAAMAVAVLVARALLGHRSGVGLLWALSCEVATGMVVFLVASIALAAFSASRRRLRVRRYGPPLRTLHPPVPARRDPGTGPGSFPSRSPRRNGQGGDT